MDWIETYDVQDLKLFYGNMAKAREAALRDYDQYEVSDVLAYDGTSEARTEMQFYIRFADGDERWVHYTNDLRANSAFVAYCYKHSNLNILTQPSQNAAAFKRKHNNTPITGINIGDVRYVDIRAFADSYEWYESLDLPSYQFKTYVLHMECTKWCNKKRTAIHLYSPIWQQAYEFKGYKYFCYGQHNNLRDDMTLIDESFIQQYPQLEP